MLTIVVFHSSSGLFNDNFVQQLMGNPWNVAVFFIVGGFYLNLDKLANPKSFLLKKFKTLYVPATIIYLFAVLLHNVFVSIGWYPLAELHPGNGQPFMMYGVKEFAIGCLKVLCCGGSGELAMGAMWFLYTLIYSFVGLSTLWWAVCKLLSLKDNEGESLGNTAFNIMSVVLLVLACVSCVLTQLYEISINRFSTAVTAMFLIWTGMVVNKRLKWSYNNVWMFVSCLVIFIQCVLLQKVGITMAKNEYQDLLQLVVGSCCLIYVWGYIAKRISNCFVGKFLALVGKESLYVMALHIVGFFMCNSLLKSVGVFADNAPHGMYTCNMGGRWWIFLLYMAFGIGFPLLTICIFRSLRRVMMF